MYPLDSGLSRQLLGHDFLFAMTVEKSGSGKSEEGKEWDRTRGDQTERVRD